MAGVRPTESAVLVPLPEAEGVVGRFRAELDQSAAWGVPPHVTVLYPFLAPDELEDQSIRDLAAAVAAVPAFEVSLGRTGWFGDTVLWLGPEPDRPFRDLTGAVHRRFPGYPPYRGAHPDLVPHLTVGHDAPVDALRAAAVAIEPCLPIRSRVTAARLMQGTAAAGSWHTVAVLPLGPARTGPR